MSQELVQVFIYFYAPYVRVPYAPSVFTVADPLRYFVQVCGCYDIVLSTTVIVPVVGW